LESLSSETAPEAAEASPGVTECHSPTVGAAGEAFIVHQYQPAATITARRMRQPTLRRHPNMLKVSRSVQPRALATVR
jgi:hypothetical protein